MKHLLATILFLFLANIVHGQRKLTITLVGSVTNFITSEKLFGATLYMMQNGKTVSKAITDETGRYNISGFVLVEQPFDLLISKPGYASKKVLFELDKLKLKNSRSTNLQLLEDLTIELFENMPGSDLSFTKTTYAEKFFWDENANSGFGACVPNSKIKSDFDKKVTQEYAKVKNNGTSKNFVSRGDIANKNRQFEKAVAYYDSALVATPNDSLIKIKKDIVLNTIKKIQEEETKKANYSAKKILADTALNKGDLGNAEKYFKDILIDFPGDSYATSQITKIYSLKNQQEQDKKNKAEADKLIAQAETLKNSKKYDEAISKYQQALTIYPIKKNELEQIIKSIKAIQSEIALEQQINKDLKSATDLFKDNKYDQAINEHKNIDLHISKLTIQSLIDKYSNLNQQGLKLVLDKKNQEGEVRKQLQRAQDNFEKGPQFYDIAENILKGDPMKSRKNDPQVIELINKIAKMKEFYKQRNDAYDEVKRKKNSEALVKLKSTRDFGTNLGQITPQSELTKLKFSIDSIENIIKSQNNIQNVTQTNNSLTNGIKLKAPGELVTDNPNDVFNELASDINSKKEAPFENLTQAKTEIDKEVDFNKKLNASRQEDEIENIQNKKTELELKAIEQSTIPIKLQENIDENKRQLEVDLYNKQQENVRLNENHTVQIQDWKDNQDSLSVAKSIEKEKKTEYEMTRIEDTKNTIELNANIKKNENVALAQSLQDTKTETEYAQFKKDSLGAVLEENRGVQIQQKKDFQKENKLTPNHIKDEQGIEFPWNAVTERVYKLKNKEGFITAIITRRVVVDKNGYGVVYEQNTNEMGINSFFKNGAPITEYIWANESMGVNVIEK